MDQTSHPVDRHVGARIRALRLERGLSQTELGNHLGVSFQQIQKYEHAMNRVSASKLYQMAEAFAVSICILFEGLSMKTANSAEVDSVDSAQREVVLRMRDMSLAKQEDVRQMVRMLDR